MNMKKIIFTTVILASAFFSFAQTIEKIKADDVVKMIDTSKTPLVINFWATWCHPCVEEIPRLEENIAQYKTNGAQLILISLDGANAYPQKLADFAKLHGYTSKIYWLDEINVSTFFHRIDSNWFGKIPAILMINNTKHYRQFYNHSLAQYQLEAYLKDLIIR